jgi:hypothetical protein
LFFGEPVALGEELRALDAELGRSSQRGIHQLTLPITA